MGYNQHNAGLHIIKKEEYGKYDDLKLYEEKAFGIHIEKRKKTMGVDPRLSTEEWKNFQKTNKINHIEFREMVEEEKAIFLKCDSKNFNYFLKYVPQQTYNDYCTFIKGGNRELLMFDFYIIFKKLGVTTISKASLKRMCSHFQESIGTVLIETQHFPNKESFNKGLYYFLSRKIRSYLHHREIENS